MIVILSTLLRYLFEYALQHRDIALSVVVRLCPCFGGGAELSGFLSVRENEVDLVSEELQG